MRKVLIVRALRFAALVVMFGGASTPALQETAKAAGANVTVTGSAPAKCQFSNKTSFPVTINVTLRSGNTRNGQLTFDGVSGSVVGSGTNSTVTGNYSLFCNQAGNLTLTAPATSTVGGNTYAYTVAIKQGGNLVASRSSGQSGFTFPVNLAANVPYTVDVSISGPANGTNIGIYSANVSIQ